MLCLFFEYSWLFDLSSPHHLWSGAADLPVFFSVTLVPALSFAGDSDLVQSSALLMVCACGQ